MDQALITLLDKKEFAYITIREICEVARVNRSTFYLHYENTSDLLRETTRYIIDKHLAYYSIETASVSLRLEACETKDLLFITEEYLTPYLTFIKENQKLFKIAVKQFNTLKFGEVYENMFTHLFSPILSRFGIPERQRTYVMKFYLSGVFAIVMEWLDKDCNDDIDTIIKIITACVMGERSVDK